MGEKRDNPELDAAKRDLSYMLAVLNIGSTKTKESNAPCPICGDKTCLQFGPDKKKLGEFYWHCNKGCGGGDIVDALMKTRNLDYKGAFAKIREDFRGRAGKTSSHDQYHKNNAIARTQSNGVNPHGYTNGVVGALRALGDPGAPSEPRKVDPAIDKDRAEAYVAKQHAYLMDNFDLVTKWRRGLSREVCEKYRIGFTEFGTTQFAPWQKPMEIPAAWVLPITNSDGAIKGVKVHFEERPTWNNKKCPKLLWLPFGTLPAYEKTKDADGRDVETKPIHAYDTMWPHPANLVPQVVSDFSLDASFWIARIPPKLKPEWDDVYLAQKYKLADERGITVEDVDWPELDTVMLRAFDEMKKKIFDAVLKIENEQSDIQNQSDEDWSDYVFITTGELKALACESAGLMATASTAGEGRIPGREYLVQFAGQKICLLADDDPPKKQMDPKAPENIKKIFCTGREWVTKMGAALVAHGAAHVVAKYGGKKG